MLKNYRELEVWQNSYKLCLEICRYTARFPKEERYGPTSQIRRCVVSVPSNIAEGYGRKTTLDNIRMLYISYGSVCELETQILLAGDLGFIEKGDLSSLKNDIAEIERTLKALIKSLENKPLNPLLQPKRRRSTVINWIAFAPPCNLLYRDADYTGMDTS